MGKEDRLRHSPQGKKLFRQLGVSVAFLWVLKTVWAREMVQLGSTLAIWRPEFHSETHGERREPAPSWKLPCDLHTCAMACMCVHTHTRVGAHTHSILIKKSMSKSWSPHFLSVLPKWFNLCQLEEWYESDYCVFIGLNVSTFLLIEMPMAKHKSSFSTRPLLIASP